MKKIFISGLLLTSGLFYSGLVKAQAVSLTTAGSAYTQDFNTLSNTAGSTTNNLTITGWFMTESGGGARDNEQYAVDTGGSTTGDSYSYGSAASTDRALGQLRSGTLIPLFGAVFTNNTGATLTSLDIAYVGEEWRLGTAARTDQMNFEYSLNATDLVTGTWTNVSALNFVTPATATAGAKDGNAAANKTSLSATISSLSIPNGATFWVRWNDTDASGADDGLAIDDFSLTPQAASTPNLTIDNVTANETNAGTTTFTFTVSLSAPAGAGGVTFDIATADGTGTTGDNDYVSNSLTSQTIAAGNSTYTFDVTVNGDATCEGSESFFVNVTNVSNANVTDGQGQGTISNDDNLVADDPVDVSNCGPYTLPALTVGNYYDGPAGTGTLYNAGDVISSDMTLYVYAASGTCTDENDFEIEIKAIPTITATVSASRCGTGAITLEATPSAGQIDWFTASTGGSSGYTGNTINLSLSSTKTYYVEASDNGCVSAARTAVTATIDFCSQVQASQCGSTLATPSTAIIADAAVGATHYRFEIDGTTTVTKTTRTLYLANFTYTYGSTYSVKVAVSNDGTTFSAYGSACNITAPAIPTTQVQASQCGATLTNASTAIIADAVTGATHYRFRIDGTQIVTKTTRTLYVGNFTYAYGSTYSIEVAASQDGTTFGAYGSACNITAPNAPTTQVQASQCGATIPTATTPIIADAITGATHYRFEINGGAQYVTKTTRTLYLGNFTYSAGSTYAIRVSYSFDGTNFLPYGSSCNINAINSPLIKQDENIYEADGDLMTDISVEAFPNPNSGDFTITSTHEGTFSLVNELGQLIQTIEITKENNYQVQVGLKHASSPLHPGVYFITGTINNAIITKKVMVLK